MKSTYLAAGMLVAGFSVNAFAQQQPSPSGDQMKQPGLEQKSGGMDQPSQPGIPSQKDQMGQPGAKPMGQQDMPKTASTASLMTIDATVEKVDMSKREVSLKTQDGNSVMVQVPENVQKLDTLKPGDKMTIDYYQSAALTLKKSAMPISAETRTFSARPSSNMPGGMMGQEISATAKVTKVDANKGLVMIEGPEGKKDTINVTDPQLKSELKKLKVGDGIEVTYTEAMAISMNKKG